MEFEGFFRVILLVKTYWITKCTTTGYSYSPFSPLIKKEGRRKGERITITGFKQVFIVIHSIFTILLTNSILIQMI